MAAGQGAAPHLVTLVMAAAVGSLAMNIFLPSLPGMAHYFDSDYAIMQLAVSLYLAATAVLQLFIGPASDRFGRRPVMLTCFAIFLVGTLAAVYAPTVEVLLACRLLQAFSSAGMVISRAVVRDTVSTAEAASQIGYITMGMSVVPMIGPMIGGFLDELYGWQASFWLTLAFGVVAFVIVLADLGETNRNRSESLAAQFRAYPQLLGSPRFWGYSLTAAFTTGAFFAFIGGGPYVASEMLYLTPSQYGFYFGIISLGYMFGNFLSGRYAGRIGINRMMLSGNIVGAAGMLLSIGLFGAGVHHPLSLFGPVFFTGIGNGLTLPSANAGIVSVKPHLAGSASGLGGALQIGGGAALSVLAGALLTPQTGPFPLLWVMLLSSAAAALSTFYVIHVARRERLDP
ncbi:multidrug effflux MFS transporter [Mesorhizobium sp. YM1C-6-2]|uniref:multidrug effflux MFS transporter n=1 Tax=Mesorhizobium sp. YM1C-6-2 TaxID=1827501 RepID=UPI000EF1B25B|nr:multidrug effflux MFS transporter [Mesorhizobium sp. YM1C-6-2]RLP22666.1 Bcr/CflA family efflux MFS transporter [Mesorhizobium sp. YM1C-6-2]